MSAPATEELFLGTFAYLIPLGVTVDGGVVSATAKPDGVPTTNWTDYSLGSVLAFTPGVQTQDRGYKVPSALGGWETRPKLAVESDFINLKTREMGELLLRLQFGLSGPIVLGTAQTPFATTTRKVTGWLKFHMRKEDGQDLCIGDLLVDVELTNGVKADNTVSEPEFRCTVLKTYDGAAVAGNSIVFPAVA